MAGLKKKVVARHRRLHTVRGRKQDSARKNKVVVAPSVFLRLTAAQARRVDVAGVGKDGVRRTSTHTMRDGKLAVKKRGGPSSAAAPRKRKRASTAAPRKRKRAAKGTGGWKYKDHGHFPMNRRRPKPDLGIYPMAHERSMADRGIFPMARIRMPDLSGLFNPLNPPKAPPKAPPLPAAPLTKAQRARAARGLPPRPRDLNGLDVTRPRDLPKRGRARAIAGWELRQVDGAADRFNILPAGENRVASVVAAPARVASGIANVVAETVRAPALTKAVEIADTWGARVWHSLGFGPPTPSQAAGHTKENAAIAAHNQQREAWEAAWERYNEVPKYQRDRGDVESPGSFYEFRQRKAKGD